MTLHLNKSVISDKLGVTFDADEIIRVVCKPNLKSFLFKEVINMLLQILFMAGALAFFQIIAYLTNSTYDGQTMLLFFGFISLLIIASSTRTILRMQTVIYVITDRTLIIHHDSYNSSTKTVHLKEIKTKELKKTLVDKHFGTGTIKIFTGETKVNDGRIEKIYDKMNCINEPEKIFALLKT